MKRLSAIIILLLIALIPVAQTTTYIKHTPCTFAIELPAHMKLSNMFSDQSPDYCDYKVRTQAKNVSIELHSLNKSRFTDDSLEELYDAALASSEINITYKKKGVDYFVISGFERSTGYIVYWKRSVGSSFIGDLYITYPNDSKSAIEPYLTRMSRSFSAD